MPKRLTIYKRPDALIPAGDVGVLQDIGRIREHYESMTNRKQKQRFVAFLHGIYTAKQLEKLIGVTKSHVHYCAARNQDVTEAAQLGRCTAIGHLCGVRAIEILQKVNVNKIQDRYKPKAVKDLMDSMDIATMHTGQKPQQEDDDDVFELVMRVKKKQRPLPNDNDNEDDERKTIDINDQVEVKK